MSELTLLTKEQCFGENMLDVIKQRGPKAAITDFAILLGSTVTNYYINNDNSLNGRTGTYWTQSDEVYNINEGGEDQKHIYVVEPDGCYGMNIATSRCIGARPVLSSSVISTNASEVVVDGIREVEYGYYPRSAVDKETQNILTKQLNLRGYKKRYTRQETLIQQILQHTVKVTRISNHKDMKNMNIKEKDM